MSNHFHILATPQEDNLGEAMSYFLTNLSKYLNFVSGRKNHIFGDRYKPTVIKNEKHLINAIRYIYQNPVSAKMVHHVGEYRYSSLGFYIGESAHGLIIHPDLYTKDFLDSGAQSMAIWYRHVSMSLDSREVELLRHSFKRRVFKFSKRQIQEGVEMRSSLVF